MFMDFNGAFNSINKRKEGKYAFWEHFNGFELTMDFTKEISSLVSLIAFVVLNNSIGVEKCIC